jgi:hypothetical protein
VRSIAIPKDAKWRYTKGDSCVACLGPQIWGHGTVWRTFQNTRKAFAWNAELCPACACLRVGRSYTTLPAAEVALILLKAQ